MKLVAEAQLLQIEICFDYPEFRITRCFLQLAGEKDLKMQEALSSLNWPEWLKKNDRRIFSLKTCLGSFRMTKAGHLVSSSPRFMTWGIMSNGLCLTANILESRNQHGGCSLSDILIPDAPEKYFLSLEQMQKLLYRSSMDGYRDLILENTDYDVLASDPHVDREQLDEIVDLLQETVCSTRSQIRVAGNDYPAEVVRSKLLKLNSEHIRFVMDCLKQNTTRIRNIRQYLLSMLFNAPSTMNSYYTALVAHDMATA